MGKSARIWYGSRNSSKSVPPSIGESHVHEAAGGLRMRGELMKHQLSTDILAARPEGAVGLFRSTKTYDHNEGLSCCFRQWRATDSHCSLLHGYALSFRFVFACSELDERNWCYDFGALKPVRAWLKSMFDHTMLVA